ncbi:LmbE family N-acetylglucosaminyl deacetylase [Saccharothrix saharensis]|uniref:LmbE family N-acetylglucosaminyl deacetylase n=1 Tax=Saccharothrix saharensis TaxID=571190 RepID=A0A543JI90_9PSEU|nr:PIG-L family deacetylase [Saccharothrix saharensis]TQM82525.1 LmbE family N-acetylglucosaminyl deacetylase [Saccharothrix saharensis]
MSRTCVFFHAHPDDEALLTGGTMARLAREGHRVVLVVATAGERGLSAHRTDLGTVRTKEAHAAARALGCARVEFLGYPDSGLDGRRGFARADVGEAAERLAELLHEERADLLTAYDPHGGYGHPDHVQVHRVGALAAELAGTPRVWEATVDRTWLLRGLRLARLVRDFDLEPFERAYTARAEITHSVDVRRYAGAKRRAMAAHATQTTGGDSSRTLAALLKLPPPLFRTILGTEWYVERKRLRAR